MNTRSLPVFMSRATLLLVATGGALALGALSGCATSPGNSSAPDSSVRLEWQDPDFYAPAHDRRSIVLPPPPFTGFSTDGKTAPLLPTRQRPASDPASATP
ncbi:MAG: hypothetical protein MUE42_07600 [Opitutaceae bacterium]|jgi:hypothetical protein|nr:hypothetical protein [Opitutaceae bacterium]